MAVEESTVPIGEDETEYPGRVDPDVDPVAMEAAFKGLVSAEVMRTIVYQATTGEEIYLNRWPTRTWARESATAEQSNARFGAPFGKTQHLGVPLSLVRTACDTWL